MKSTTPGGTDSEAEHLGHVITVFCGFGGGGGGGWVDEVREELDWDNPRTPDKLAFLDWREEDDEGIELDGDRGGWFVGEDGGSCCWLVGEDGGGWFVGEDGGGWLTGEDGGWLVGEDGVFIDLEEAVGELGVGDYE